MLLYVLHGVCGMRLTDNLIPVTLIDKDAAYNGIPGDSLSVCCVFVCVFACIYVCVCVQMRKC